MLLSLLVALLHKSFHQYDQTLFNKTILYISCMILVLVLFWNSCFTFYACKVDSLMIFFSYMYYLGPISGFFIFQATAFNLFVFIYTHSIKLLHKGSGQFDKTIIYLNHIYVIAPLWPFYPTWKMAFLAFTFKLLFICCFCNGRWRLACPFFFLTCVLFSVVICLPQDYFSILLCVVYKTSRL